MSLNRPKKSRESLNQGVAQHLAENLVKLRRKKRWSQMQLAKVAGIPRSTLTHIESGESNPSLKNLVSISSALGVGLEELLSRPRSESVLILSSNVQVVPRSRGSVKMYKLLPDKIRGIDVDRVEFEPESQMGGHPHLIGTKEYLTVIEGELFVHVSGEEYCVKKGDVLAFPGNQPHSYRNPFKLRCVALSVVIPVLPQI